MRRLLILLLCCWFPVMVLAQDGQPRQLVINYPEFIQEGERQVLNLYFNLTNELGQVVSEPRVDSAQMTIAGVDYPVEVRVPDAPLYVALALDTSGSMRQLEAAMKAAAIDAVNAAPAGTYFAVLHFNQTVTVREPTAPFSNSPNATINRIGEIPSTAFTGGGCLYDAAFDALNLLRGAGVTGRRALILFTDGRDELTAGQGDRCSRRADYNSLVDLASQIDLRIPIYTIGMRGNVPIDEIELRNMAGATGGVPAFNTPDQINALFQQAVRALTSQRQVQAAICVPEGQHPVVFTLSSGGALLTQATTFQASGTCIPSTPTPTPAPLSLALEAFRYDPAAEQLSFTVARQGDGTVAQYRVQIKYRNTGIQVDGDYGDFRVDALEQVTLNTGSIRGGEPLVITLRPLDADGLPVGVDAVGEVALQRPTPTATLTDTPAPSPSATSMIATPVPIEMQVDSVRYDADTEQLLFNIAHRGEGEVVAYRVQIKYRSTGIQIDGPFGDFRIDTGVPVVIPTENIRGGEPLTITLYALDVNGTQISAGFPNEVTVARPTPTATITPTPTLTPSQTPTLTPTPTPIAPVITNVGINLDENQENFLLDLAVTNIDVVTGFTIRIEDKSGFTVFNREARTAPPAQVTIPTSEVESGEYNLVVELMVAGDALPARAEKSFTFNRPEPRQLSLPERLAETVRAQPVVGLALALVALVLMLLLIWWLGWGRRRGDPGPIILPPDGPDDDNKTEVPDGEPLAGVNARLRVVRAPGLNAGQEFPISSSPYRIGREHTDRHKMNLLLADKQVSRFHASIIAEGDDYLIIDEGSTSGTFVNGQRVREPYVVKPGTEVTLKLGANTELRLIVGRETIAPAAHRGPAPIFADSPLTLPFPEKTEIERDMVPPRLNALLRLVKLNDESVEGAWAVSLSPFRVGRRSDNDVQLESRAISGTHMILHYYQGVFYIEDNASNNKTYLNGADVPLAPRERVPLEPMAQHVITLGRKTVLVFSYGDSDQDEKTDIEDDDDRTQVELD